MVLKSLLIHIFIASAFCISGQNVLKELPSVSPVLSGYTRESAERNLRESGPHRIEGIWQFTDDGATMTIERFTPTENHGDESTAYRIVLLRSPNRALRPGTVMGYLYQSSKSGVYLARIYTSSHNGSKLSAAKDFTITLTENDSHLTLARQRDKYSVNVWRMLPYMFRYTVKRNTPSDANLHGCIKLFPQPSSPIEPIYL